MHILHKSYLRRFRRLLEFVLKTNTFYKKKYTKKGIVSAAQIKTWEDFFSLPLTTRYELIGDQERTPPFGTNISRPLSQYSFVIRTSGTSTGRPFFQPLTHDEFNRFVEVMIAGYEEMGLKSGDIVSYVSAPHAYPLFYEITHRMGARMVPVETHTSFDFLTRIQTMNVNVLQAYPTALFELMELAKDHHIDLRRLGLKKIFTIGEVGGGHPPTKALLERVWGAKVIDHIGSLESGTLAVICPKGNGYHLLEDLFIAEVFALDADIPTRRGELVLTSFWRRDYPLIRYRTGDMVEIEYGRCSCGKTTPRLINGILGRVTGQLRLRAAMLFPEDIERVLRSHTQVLEYQVICRKPHGIDVVDIYAELSLKTTRGELVALIDDLDNLLGFAPNLYPMLPKMLPRFDLQKGSRFHDYRISKTDTREPVGLPKRILSKIVWSLFIWNNQSNMVKKYISFVHTILKRN